MSMLFEGCRRGLAAIVGGAAVLALAPAAASDDGGAVTAATVVGADGAADERPMDVEFGGYGELHFGYYDHGLDRNRRGGSQRDRRAQFDTTRLVLELELELPGEVEIEAEVEFEHGGVGAAMELEYEEFGEYEQEIEKGGEVLVEELYISKSFADRVDVAIGRFYVAVGQLSAAYRPIDYLATVRSEAETTLIPAVWDEMGAQVRLHLPVLRLTLQAVSGLDSTGFDSQRWVANGHQARFEVVRATDMAAVGRADALLGKAGEAGVSVYYGGTSRNRPKADLVPACAGGDAREAAPCGYVHAPVLMVDAHGRLRHGPLRGSGMVLWGHLKNAGDVSDRNDRLSNALDVLRTPVADAALAAWAEAGLDVAGVAGASADHAVEPFLRFDYVDTMFRTRNTLFDNPRFRRQALTGGVGWTYADTLVIKLDASHRWYGSPRLNRETAVRLAPGFVF